MNDVLNMGRRGVQNGIFGNPVREKHVSPQYRAMAEVASRENYRTGIGVR